MDNLRPALDRLVADAVLTREQAEAVVAAVARDAPARRISPVAEIVGYVGGVLAAVAAPTVASTFWSRLNPTVQIGLLVATAVLLWGAGLAVWRRSRDDEDPAACRLVAALWLLSTAATAAAAWNLVDEILGLAEGPGTLLIGLIVTAHAAVAWRLRPSGPQQIALFAGVLTTLAGVLILLDAPDPAVPLTYWALGLGWAGLAWVDVLRPRRLGAGLGAVTSVFGAEGLTFSSDTWGILLVLATVAVLFAAAALAREPVFTAVASLTLAVALPQALGTWFPGSLGAPLAVLIAGLVLLGGALATLRTSRGRDPERVVAEQ